MNRNMMRGPGGSTPNSFSSNHLRNIDSQMEMLQRKREALHFEHQKLVNERADIRKRPYEFNEPSRNLPYYHNQSNVQNFAHLYDGDCERSFGPQPNKKRPPINVWDDTRFDANKSFPTRRLGSFPGPIPLNRGPLIPLLGVAPKPIGRRILDVPIKRDRNFTPNKVTKPKSKVHPPTHYNSAPAPPKNKLEKEMRKLPILRSNEEPTGQVNGRLGLALGLIMKKMKQEYCNSEESTFFFNSKHVQRYIRKTIRDRLNTIMLNRIVGKPEEVVAAYREVYPDHTDKIIMEDANVNADYDKFLKTNINRILTQKLDELFEKMQQLCDGKDIEVRKLIKPLISSTSEDKVEYNKDVKLTQEYMNTLTITLIEQNLPCILPKYTQKIMKMLDLDNEIAAYLDKNTKKVQGQNLDENSATDNEHQNTEGVEVDATEAKNDEETEKTPKEDNEEAMDETPREDNEETPQNEEEKKNDTETAENRENLNNTVVEEPKATDKTEKPEPATPKAQQYFVKVLGQPTLPNRADAYKFFSSLNAGTIKKHKVIQNLLVVGFNNEQDYEKAVAASETVVGNCKLIIKANENQPLSTTTTPMKEKTEAEPCDVMLSNDLENQITDLLSSIRETEKESPEKAIIQKEDTSTDNIEKTEETKTEQSDGTENNDANIEEENGGKDNVTQNDNEVVEENVSSPINSLNKETENLETIKEVEEGSNETKCNVTNIKNTNTGKSTPMKTRQSVATPRTIRTRRSSKLEQQNNQDKLL